MTLSTTFTTAATARPTRRSANSSVNCSARKFPAPPPKTRTAPSSSKKPRAFANVQKKMKRAAAQVVKLGLIQTSCSADTDANLKKTISLVDRAAKKGAQIICTQELFR